MLNGVIETIANTEGRMDGLVAAAGIQQETPALEYSAKDSNTMFEVNVTGVFMTAQAVAKQMIRFGNGGSIAMIASMSGTIANRVRSPSLPYIFLPPLSLRVPLGGLTCAWYSRIESLTLRKFPYTISILSPVGHGLSPPAIPPKTTRFPAFRFTRPIPELTKSFPGSHLPRLQRQQSSCHPARP